MRNKVFTWPQNESLARFHYHPGEKAGRHCYASAKNSITPNAANQQRTRPKGMHRKTIRREDERDNTLRTGPWPWKGHHWDDARSLSRSVRKSHPGPLLLSVLGYVPGHGVWGLHLPLPTSGAQNTAPRDYTDQVGDPTGSRVYRLLLQPLCALKSISKQNVKEESPLTSLVLVMVSAMMLAAPGSSVTGINGREEAEEADGVTAEGVTASSEETI